MTREWVSLAKMNEWRQILSITSADEQLYNQLKSSFDAEAAANSSQTSVDDPLSQALNVWFA
jgi:hypothetical protein